MRDFIAAGQIGQLAILDIAHLTPDLLPTEGHQPEGPPFHDCGMHYVDLARWYAESEYADWHAQGLRIWAWPDPWWVDAHGSFQNGVVFSVTQGFCYGQGAETITARSTFEAIGTHGVVRMRHDFREVVVDFPAPRTPRRSAAPTKARNSTSSRSNSPHRSTSATTSASPPRATASSPRASPSRCSTSPTTMRPIVSTPADLAHLIRHKAALACRPHLPRSRATLPAGRRALSAAPPICMATPPTCAGQLIPLPRKT
ncbi:MAG: hypothetical protein U0841_07910 [Chloroflexia bacterium]